MDKSLDRLLNAMRGNSGPALWCVGEHASENVPAGLPQLHFLSNRIDVYDRLKLSKYAGAINDFDFASTPEFQTLYYRVSKEKPLVNYIINQAAKHLPPEGRLVLSGAKTEGIKTYAKKAAQCLGGTVQIDKDGETYLATITKGTQQGEPLPDHAYPELRNIAPEGRPELFSKPGVFGWDKIDTGSALLAKYLPDFLATFSQPPPSVLDLGCGYGFLALMAARHLPDSQITATDNNATALLACQKNFETHGVQGQTVLTDCGKSIQAPFKAILCNPPFHQGFQVNTHLGERFLHSTRRLLKTNGKALFVVNEMLPLEKKAQAYFSKIEVVQRQNRFKLVMLG